MTILAAEVTELFDPIMASIKTKLDVLASENHLKGASYDEVYSQAISTTLQQVVQLIIGTDQRELTAAKVLSEQQSKLNLIAEHAGIVANTYKTDIERIKIEADTLLIPKQGSLLDQQLINAIAEKESINAKTAISTAELQNIPKQGRLIESQIVGSGFENQLKYQQGLNLAAEATLIPKQGHLLDQQVLQSQGEVSLIPKKSQLMDAQILELNNRGKNLDLEAIKIGLEGENLRIQGTNLGFQGLALEQEIALKKLDVKNKDAERIQILTNAEQNRASALHAIASANALHGNVELGKFSAICDTYNTYMANTPDAGAAFQAVNVSNASAQVTNALEKVKFTQFYSGGVASY